jgi:hypothetical protein
MIPRDAGGFAQLKFRDPARGKALAGELARKIGRESITLMHVCGSHEQVIARFGLRASFPPSVSASGLRWDSSLGSLPSCWPQRKR